MDAAGLLDLPDRLEPLEGAERGLHDVDGIRAAEHLGQHVVDAGQLQDRARGGAGLDAGALAGGTQDDGRGAVLLADLVRDRRADDRHADEVLLDFLDALVYRERDFVVLAVAPAHASLAVAHHDERVEAEALAALDDLGAALDLDDDLLQLFARPAFATLPH